MFEQNPPTGAMHCLFCGQPERAEVFEVWEHEFMLETCCEGLHEQIVFDMNDDPNWARHFVQSLGIEDICGLNLRRVADDGCCGLILDWQLRLKTIAPHAVRSFIARHHAHCGVPVIIWTGCIQSARLVVSAGFRMNGALRWRELELDMRAPPTAPFRGRPTGSWRSLPRRAARRIQRVLTAPTSGTSLPSLLPRVSIGVR